MAKCKWCGQRIVWLLTEEGWRPYSRRDMLHNCPDSDKFYASQKSPSERVRLRSLAQELTKEVPVRRLDYNPPKKKNVKDDPFNQSGVSQFTRQISSGRPYKGYGKAHHQPSGPKTEKA